MDRRLNTRPITIEERADGGKTLIGYAAVFHRASDPGTEYELPGGVFERIDRQAFRSALGRDDVRALFNHDPSLLLGRSGAGTLRLSVDDQGLRYEVDLPNTSTGADVSEWIRRGDVTGSSFSFSVDKQEFRRDGEKRVRLLQELSLFDVGPVTYPAYGGTTVGVRSADDCREAEAALAAEKERQRLAVQVRARCVAIESGVQ